MARAVTGDKPKDIRKATVDEVAHVGSTAVSVNKIAQRAGLSVGTIYRYHQTKDDLLFAVFLDVKRDIHSAMMSAANVENTSAKKLRAMWFSLVDYGCRAPKDFLFVEMISAEVRSAVQKDTCLQDMRSEISLQIENGITDETLVEASVQSIELMLAAPAMSLARKASMTGQRPDAALVEEVFGLIWQSIARRQS